ncbi:MAG: uroporphyrinogen-III synthase [Alphaproteobacteria bacterium]|jgi:uroporphyrinogen-III synthase
MFLLVRTKDQLKKTEKFFKASDIEVASFAVSSTVFNKIDIQAEDDGFIVTSPNAVLAIPQTKLPFFCVGEVTEKEARDTGRRIAFTGNAGAEDMAKQIARRFPPEKLVHAAGDMADISWYTILESAGIQVEKRLAYHTKYTEYIDDKTLDIIQSDDLKAIVFFSTQGAETFTKLMKENHLNPENLSVITFSENIADCCSEYKAIYITAAPRLESVKNVMQAL